MLNVRCDLQVAESICMFRAVYVGFGVLFVKPVIDDGDGDDGW